MPLAVRALERNQWIRRECLITFLEERCFFPFPSVPPFPLYPVVNTAVMNSHVHNLGTFLFTYFSQKCVARAKTLFQQLLINIVVYRKLIMFHSHWQNTSACLPFTSPSFFCLHCVICRIVSYKQGLNPEIESLES